MKSRKQKNGAAIHAWDEKHAIYWNVIRIIDREQSLKQTGKKIGKNSVKKPSDQIEPESSSLSALEMDESVFFRVRTDTSQKSFLQMGIGVFFFI